LTTKTFGYSGSVPHETTCSGDVLAGSVFTTPSDFGSLISGSAWLRAVDTNKNVKMIIVNRSDLTIVPNGVSSPTIVTNNGAAFWDFTFATIPTMIASTAYIFCLIPENIINIYYEGGAGIGIFFADTSNSYASPTDPTDGTETNNYTLSIVITYNPGAPPPPPVSHGMPSEGLIIIR
jgi:hypothetical protein